MMKPVHLTPYSKLEDRQHSLSLLMHYLKLDSVKRLDYHTNDYLRTHKKIEKKKNNKEKR